MEKEAIGIASNHRYIQLRIAQNQATIAMERWSFLIIERSLLRTR